MVPTFSPTEVVAEPKYAQLRQTETPPELREARDFFCLTFVGRLKHRLCVSKTFVGHLKYRLRLSRVSCHELPPAKRRFHFFATVKSQ